MNRFANFARSALSEYLPAGGTELFIEHPEKFPYGNFTAVIWKRGFSAPSEDDGREIVLVTKTDGGMTVQRGLEGTEAADWNTGSLIANVVTAEALNGFSAAASSRTVFSETGTLWPEDRQVIFSFSESGAPKAFILPETALFSGQELMLVNGGTDTLQTVTLNTAEGDAIGNEDIPGVTLGAGCTIRMTVINGIWEIVSAELFSPRSVQRVNTSGAFHASGTMVFADASAEYISLSIPHNPAMQNVPFLVIKTDSSPNAVEVFSMSTGEKAAKLTAKGACAWLMLNGYGGIETISATGGSSSDSGGNGYTSGSGYMAITAGTELVFADTSDGYAYVRLPLAVDSGGRRVTVIKTDSGSNPVMVGSTATGDHYMFTQGEFASFACNGITWYRAG